MVACPSVAELLAKVKILTRSDGTFQTVWKDSFIDPYHCCEQGGFIYVDFPVPSSLTRAFIVKAPKGQTMNQRKDGINVSIDLNKPGTSQGNVILVANYHTHPLSKLVQGDPEPSRSDMDNAYYRGVPGIVVSREGIYSYGPEYREDLNNPKGYAKPIDLPAVPKAVLAMAAPPPWVVPYQWPEGTSSLNATDAVFSDTEADPTTNHDEGNAEEMEVIVAEWSDEGIIYGEHLTESEN